MKIIEDEEHQELLLLLLQSTLSVVQRQEDGIPSWWWRCWCWGTIIINHSCLLSSPLSRECVRRTRWIWTFTFLRGNCYYIFYLEEEVENNDHFLMECSNFHVHLDLFCTFSNLFSKTATVYLHTAVHGLKVSEQFFIRCII